MGTITWEQRVEDRTGSALLGPARLKRITKSGRVERVAGVLGTAIWTAISL